MSPFVQIGTTLLNGEIMGKRILGLLVKWIGVFGLIGPFLVGATLAAGPGHSSNQNQAHAEKGKGERSQYLMPPAYGLLRDAAYQTAAFNSGATLPPENYPAHLPFQMLYVPNWGDPAVKNNTGGASTSFYVKRGTRLYVPVIYNNDIPKVLGGHLTPLGDHDALLDYWYSQDRFGLDYAKILVDGKETSLSPGYLVDIGLDPVVNPVGQTDPMGRYQVVAAMLTPLPRGTHTVEISVSVSGKYWDDIGLGPQSWTVTYTVIVD
jgi:hypothetical protein